MKKAIRKSPFLSETSFRLSLCLLVLISLSLPIDKAKAQADEANHLIGLSLGQYFLSGGFSDQGSDAIAPALRYTYLSGDVFHLNVGLHLANLDGAQDFQMRALTVGLKNNLVYYDNLVPYLQAGLGFYQPEVEIQNESISKTAFGINLGAGADLQLNDMIDVGAGVEYHDPFDVEETTSSGQTIELSGAYFTLMLRVGYRF